MKRALWQALDESSGAQCVGATGVIMRIATFMLAACVAPVWAQEFKLSANLDRLSAKAQNSLDVTLDGSLLRFAGKFLSDEDHDQAKAKKLMAGIEGIYVRSFEFAGDGGYDVADLEAVRAQLRGPDWSRIVGVKSKRCGKDADVFLKTTGSGQIGGIVVIAAEPRRLTIVNIAGTIDPAKIVDLSGRFHIPELALSDQFAERTKSK
ncbi:MAG TPA: DUF4252 domain-containing protein [Bryobacteraceae bacterium]|nr:DUF4252 domain-containing protein [Bryobacteraceae bacterium]